MSDIAIGIPTYNGAHRVAELLRSIHLRTSLDRVRIVVVDDGSPRVDETRAVCSEWASKLPLTLIEHGTNRGISAGWNTATRATDAPLVVLINDDVIVSSEWLEGLTHVLEKSPLVGVVGQSWHAFIDEDVAGLLADPASDARVIPRDPLSKAAIPERRALYEDIHPGRVMAPTGQLFAFRRADFDAIGGFDEEYKAFYEESSFGTSMARLGKIGCQTTWPFCWHRWSATFGSSPELEAPLRLRHSQAHYRAKWEVPDDVPLGQEFAWTNPRYLGAIGDVPVEYLRRGGRVASGILRTDGAFIPNLETP